MFDTASASNGVKLALLEGQLLTGATEPKVQFEFSERLAAQRRR
jgi:hypothetical protein